MVFTLIVRFCLANAACEASHIIIGRSPKVIRNEVYSRSRRSLAGFYPRAAPSVTVSASYLGRFGLI
jgi:hypothetical protein